jgi:hypothetical protein
MRYARSHYLPTLLALPAQIQLLSLQAGRTYSTHFRVAEYPLSEGGNWINGGTQGLDWTDVRTASNKAFGTQPGDSSNPFDDSTALLTGHWGDDQSAQATVYVTSAPQNCCAEVELRLRSTITPHNLSGYEFNCSVARSTPYMQIGVWPGPLGSSLSDYPLVAERTDMGCADGDVLKATAVGSTLTIFKNGVPVLSGTDVRFSSGAPGVGWFVNQTGINADFGFSSFAASDFAPSAKHT